MKKNAKTSKNLVSAQSSSPKKDEESNPTPVEPHCRKVLEAGVNEIGQLIKVFSLIMADLICERLTPQLANSITNAGGKLMKAEELKQKYGRNNPGQDGKELRLIV